MKRFLLLISMLQLAAIRLVIAQKQPELTLSIVPTSYASVSSKEASIELARGPLHVLLTNNSSEPIKLFEEWNSWGYFGLSFEIIYPDGRKVRSVKADRPWDHNFPSTITIAPHGYYIFDVDFNNDSKQGAIWLNAVRGKKPLDKEIHCSMRAIYSIKSSTASIKENAWTGTVSSEVKPYIIWY